MSFGADYAFAPSPGFWASPQWIAALQHAGVKFVVRYISSNPDNDHNGKNLLPAECHALLAAGIRIVVVVEEGAGWMLGGHNAGVTAARHADAVVKALGMPDIPVYFAADFDARPQDQPPINACLDGAASVLGDNRGRNLYGGFWPTSRALGAGKAVRTWQTLAWSGGQWDQRAVLRQGLQIRIGGAAVDPDYSEAADFGQWPRPAVPSPDPSPGGGNTYAEDDDIMWLPDTDQGIPVAFDTGVSRLRFFASKNTEVRVDWVGVTPDAASVDVPLSYPGAEHDVAPPPGGKAAVVHRKDLDPADRPLVSLHLVR